MTGAPRSRVLRMLFLGLAVGFLAAAGALAADEPKAPVIDLPEVFKKPVPENLEELKAIQKQTVLVVEKVMPAVVGIQMGPGQGSGVIVSKEGYVLTAGHVSGTPGKNVTVIFPDGRKVKAKTLGANKGIDSGMIKIEEEGTWPFVEMGQSTELKAGTWCLAIGQPGGFRPGRTPPVRLGRVLENTKGFVRTDCTLVGGDSGGPLFDLQGRVIGIHSRIGGSITANIHVPVDTYRDTWDRLARGEAWGGSLGAGAAATPYLGVLSDPEAKDACKVKEVQAGSPAEKAGIKVNDIITKFDGQKVAKFEDLSSLVSKKKPGEEVALEVQRGEETLTLKATVGRRMN